MPRWPHIGAVAVAAMLAAGTTGCSDDEEAAPDEVDVAVLGDSFAEISHDQFIALAEAEGLTTEYHAFGGVAVCDWDRQARALVDREPKQLVLSFAGNDVTPCINPSGQPREPGVVAADYRQAIDEIVAMFRSAGTQVYVVEPPPIREPAYEARAEAMRDMYQQLDNDSPRVRSISTAPALGPDGQFHEALPCQSGEECGPGGTVVLRDPDGIHLTEAGSRRYAQVIMEELVQDAEVR